MRILYYTNKLSIESLALPSFLEGKHAEVTLASHHPFDYPSGVKETLVIPDYRWVSCRDKLMDCLSAFIIHHAASGRLTNHATFTDLLEAMRYHVFFQVEKYFFLKTLHDRFIKTKNYDWLVLDIENFDSDMMIPVLSSCKKLVFAVAKTGKKRRPILFRQAWFFFKQLMEVLKSDERVSIKNNLQKEKPLSLFLEFSKRNTAFSITTSERLGKRGIETLLATDSEQIEKSCQNSNARLLWTNRLLGKSAKLKCLAATVKALFLHERSQNYKEESFGLLAKLISRRLFKDIYKTLTAFSAIGAILENCKIQLVASTSIANHFVRSGLILARRNGIPTFLLQHGNTHSLGFECHILQNHLLVWGCFNKRQLLNNCRELKNITITGFTKIGVVGEHINSLNGSTSLDRPLTATYFPTTVNGASVSLNDSVAILRMIQEAARLVPNYRFYIKPKPDGSDNFYRDYVEFYSERKSTEGQIINSDVAIVTSSTVGIEACWYDKDIIVMLLPGMEPQYFQQYTSYNAGLIARNGQELRAALRELAQNGKVRERLKLGRKKLIEDLFSPEITAPMEEVVKAMMPFCLPIEETHTFKAEVFSC